MAFPDTTPRLADSNNNLLYKIAQELSTRNGGAYPPRLADTDNNLLYKICQLIILGGGSVGTCAADLAACQAAAADNAAYRQFATTSPANYPIAAAFGYTTNNRNFPGLLSLTFLPSSTISGFSINLQTSLQNLTFAALASLPTGALATVQSNSALTSLSFPALVTSSVSITITNNTLLSNFSVPILTSVAGLTFTGNGLPVVIFPALVSSTSTLSLGSSPLMTSLSLPAFSSGTTILGGSSVNLTSASLPSLVTLSAGSGINFSACTQLSSVILTSYLPNNGQTINFGSCALSQTSVDHILARAVANAAYVTGTITLNGGTNATPSAAGLVNKATLQARGCTVNTN